MTNAGGAGNKLDIEAQVKQTEIRTGERNPALTGKGCMNVWPGSPVTLR